MRFYQGVSHTLVAKLSIAILQIVTGIITAKVLGAEGRGVYSLYFSSAALLALFLNFGFSQSIVYFRNVEKVPNNVLFGNGLLLIGIQIILVVSLFVLIPNDLIAKHAGAIGLQLQILLAVMVMIGLADSVLSGFILANHFYDLNAKNIILQGGAVFIAAIPLLIITTSVDESIIYRVLLLSIPLLLIGIVAQRSINIGRLKLDIVILWNQLRFGFKNYVQNIIGFSNARIYLYFLVGFTTASDVGVFSVILIFIEGLRFIPDAVGTVLLARLTSLSQEAAASFVAQVLRIVFWFDGILVVGVIIFGGIAIGTVFGEEYLVGFKTLRLMALGAWSGVCYQTLTRYFTSQGKQVNSLVAASCGLCVSIVTSMWLIPLYGIHGAGISYLFGNLTAAWIILRRFIVINDYRIGTVFKICMADFEVVKDIMSRYVKSSGLIK